MVLLAWILWTQYWAHVFATTTVSGDMLSRTCLACWCLPNFKWSSTTCMSPVATIWMRCCLSFLRLSGIPFSIAFAARTLSCSRRRILPLLWWPVVAVRRRRLDSGCFPWLSCSMCMREAGRFFFLTLLSLCLMLMLVDDTLERILDFCFFALFWRRSLIDAMLDGLFRMGERIVLDDEDEMDEDEDEDEDEEVVSDGIVFRTRRSWGDLLCNVVLLVRLLLLLLLLLLCCMNDLDDRPRPVWWVVVVVLVERWSCQSANFSALVRDWDWFKAVDSKCALARLAASRWEAARGDMCRGDDNCMVLFGAWRTARKLEKTRVRSSGTRMGKEKSWKRKGTAGRGGCRGDGFRQQVGTNTATATWKRRRGNKCLNKCLVQWWQEAGPALTSHFLLTFCWVKKNLGRNYEITP